MLILITGKMEVIPPNGVIVRLVDENGGGGVQVQQPKVTSQSNMTVNS